MSIVLTIDVKATGTLHHAVKDCIELAKKLDVLIRFSFEEIVLIVSPDDKPDIVVMNYFHLKNLRG